ncbi:kynurenine/alpha-aminoadipate aminotransferase, mitochondrial-like isoform X1 [Biomphalaria glabrata]|uniref:Kynurenine/alpha-aminoadipate aminotransferase, mitochondrial-like isoform X1 n=1 Tax=Biomphalaria glabrata TaxID=6526 RepID=A0A9U8EI21_BIOGL|nr:kynurenine/alpha-aminoadipate aminotransferase, mitochondrial-like isoform X1 [Biomphalaria glabrata]XP_055886660.1 kynurenine/alpha-aminoadipate aminotransferase, mitochondrial-like isoform X1 [Biomphalaria glabrata]KAI8787444.1 kynurenine/alpha-aminoadipate aminotransferase, mitochondrial isoform X1 [Biomphalaria glabrata]
MSSKSNAVEDHLQSAVHLPNYWEILSKAGKRITDNKLRSAGKQYLTGGKSIMLSGGLPNQKPLPIKKIQFTMSDGHEISLSDKEVAHANSYGLSEGITELRDWLLGLHKLEHKPPQLTRKDHPEPFALTITNGITDGIRTCFHILLDEGDSVLMERETYSNTLTLLQLFAASPVAVNTDEDGINAKDLEAIMSSWPEVHPHSKRPRVMYITPACSNPTGYTWSEQNMVNVYKVCRKYDVIIIEDSAYYFLQFGERQRTFQSIDVDGRVIRLDTFSKTIGAGYRLGWISGPSTLTDRYVLSMSQYTAHPCVLSQIMINHILQYWGYETFNKQMIYTSEIYRNNAEILASALDKYLTGLATWSFPRGGMFMWLKINDIADTSVIMREASQAGVSLISGDFFVPEFKPTCYIRLSFSMADMEDIEQGIKIFADVIKAKKKECLCNGTQ